MQFTQLFVLCGWFTAVNGTDGNITQKGTIERVYVHWLYMKTQTTKENKYGKIVGEQLNKLPQLLKWRCWQDDDDDDASTEANILLEEF